MPFHSARSAYHPAAHPAAGCRDIDRLELRAACRAGSKAAFISKLSIALEEIDEAGGWLQRLENNRLAPAKEVARLLQEADEISAILNASRETATGRRRRRA